MRAGTRLLGKVNDERGVPIVGASVVVEFGDGRDPILSVSDSDGAFVIQAVSGPVSLVVTAVGHERVVQKRTLSPGTLTPVEQSVEVRLSRANKFVEGRVVDSSGFSVRGASLHMEVSGSALPRRSQRSDDEGHFRIDGLAKGTHWVVGQHPDYPSMRWKVTTDTITDLVMPLGGTLELTLIDKGAQSAIAMAKVELVPAATPGASPLHTLSDEFGKARFAAMQAGKYLVRAKLPGFAAISKEVHIPQGQRIQEVTKTLRLELVRGATVAGILRDAVGERLVGARIVAGVVESISDREGRFRLQDVASGSIVLRIRHGKVEVEKELQLVAGEERVTLELVFDPTLEQGTKVQEEVESQEDSDSDTESDDDESGDEAGSDEDESDEEAVDTPPADEEVD
jgi:hypothetical protein